MNKVSVGKELLVNDDGEHHVPVGEKWRPTLHFTPKQNWVNDPNGLFYKDGIYHLYFQHNPKGNRWGNMSWGHATSLDLLRWTEHEVAIEPEGDSLGYIFSGSCVLGLKNSALPYEDDDTVYAFFTQHCENNIQTQSAAYSFDGGFNWNKFSENPIIENPSLKDFRDPKVFWHPQTSKWIMLLAAGHVIKFYQSCNLSSWDWLSDFGDGYGCHAGEWECPDLIPFELDSGETKWVLLVSLNPGGPNGGSGTQYFVGNFDGQNFSSDHLEERWFDYGPDNYAGVTFANVKHRKILIGWMSNWSYAADVPTQKWCGGMTLPRELNLLRHGSEYRIANNPVRELGRLKSTLRSDTFQGAYTSSIPVYSALDIQLNFLSDKPVDYKVSFCNAENETLDLWMQIDRNKLYLDRRNSGFDLKLWTTPLIEAFVLPGNTSRSLRIILDQGSIEIFIGDGSTSITALLFPSDHFSQLNVSAGMSECQLTISHVQTT